MTNPIVVGVAPRDDDDAPLTLGHELARFTGAPLALAHVYPYDESTPMPAPAYADTLREDALVTIALSAEPLLEAAEAALHAEPNLSPVRGLREAAGKLDAALLRRLPAQADVQAPRPGRGAHHPARSGLVVLFFANNLPSLARASGPEAQRALIA